MPEITTIKTKTGQTIAATLFKPSVPAKGAVVLAPAMGVGQRFYSDMAEWLKENGFLAVTFDYTGMGQSRTENLESLAVSITDWAQHDCAEILELARAEAPSVPLHWIGHSLGGQIVGLIPNFGQVSTLVTVASGSGYWLENARPTVYRSWFLWFFLAPLMPLIYGYFPGKKLGIVGDLPKNVIRQWRQWCLNKHYLFGIEDKALLTQYEKLRLPITSLSFTDDEMMSARNIHSLHSFFPNAVKEMIRLSPADVGAKRIGHFGFFRHTFRNSLWERYLLPTLK